MSKSAEPEGRPAAIAPDTWRVADDCAPAAVPLLNLTISDPRR